MNNIILIMVAIGVILIIGITKRKFDNNSKTDPDKKEDETENFDYNDEFIENSEGKKVIPFIRTFALKDKLILRSLLSSEGILTYVGSEQLNNLYPGLMIQGYTDTIIHIFDEDKERARPIVEDYIRNLIESINPEIKVKAVDFMAILAALPTSLNQIIPEILE